MRDSQLPKSGLVYEEIPSGGVREGHEVVDVFDSVLGLKGVANFSTLGNLEA